MRHNGILIPGMFDLWASRRPQQVAVTGPEDEITYAALARDANRLAHYLRAEGAGTGTVVGVRMERGIGVIRCVLGILKAGAAYLPLDDCLPPARLTRMREQAGAAFVLAGHDLRRLPLEEFPDTPPSPGPHAGDVAYEIFTSGSAGQPKPVAVGHGSLACVIGQLRRAYQVTPQDRVLQFASLGFDTSIEQILVTLTSGATLVLPPRAAEHAPLAPADLLGYLARRRITVLDLTPAYWHRLLALVQPADERLASVRLMITGGDAANAQDCRAARAAAPGARLLNAYGLTETTITSTLYEVPEDLAGPVVPAGKPLPHARLLVLDERRRPVPPGVPGEIYIGGCGVAQGYPGNPELTAARFLPGTDSRLFRTGDLGVLRADGDLEITGRADRQLKIRGYRVEPGEIEAVLATHPAVDLVAVVARDAAHGDKRLAAYYTLRAGGEPVPGEHELRDFAATRLPAFMLPAAYVPLDHMPLTPEGKVDRQALAYPVVAGGHSPDGERYTFTQAGVSHLWARLLGTDRVDRDDDFFRLGGNSLLAAEMLARARVMFGVGATSVRPLTRALLRDPTPRGFAAAIQAARAGRLASGDASNDIDFAAQATLDVPVCGTGEGGPPRWHDPAHVLLTGATGFFGSHLLRELLAKTSARVHCLVRAGDQAQAARRITAAAARFAIADLDMNRVTAIPGDLAEPELGLPARVFDDLARTVDVIYHAGAMVNFVYPYEELRRANVGGTRELIRLAGRYRRVPFHHVSTTAVLAGFGVAGVRTVSEDEPLAHADRLCVGYVQSKYVAEELLRAAGRAGLPVAIYRPMDIVGSASTGAWHTSAELCGLMKFIADTGLAPGIDLLLDLVPADVFAAAMVRIAATAGAPGRTFHIAAPGQVPFGYLTERLRRHGYRVAELSYQDWVHELLRHAAAHPAHPMTPFVPLFVDRCPGTDLTIAEMYLAGVFPAYATTNTERALRGTGISFPPVTAGLLDRNIQHLMAAGFLRTPDPGRTAPVAG